MIDRSIYFLLYGIFIFFLLLILVLLYIMIQRMREVYINDRVKQYIREHNDDWYFHLIEGHERANLSIISDRYTVKAVEEILIRYAKNIKSDTVIQKISQYSEANLQDYYRKQLASTKWSIRMNVLYKIITFRMHFLIEDVLAMLNSHKNYSDEEYLQMYKILALFHHEKFIFYLLHPKCSLGEYEYKKLVFNVHRQQLDELRRQYDQLPEMLKYVVIDAIGMQKNLEDVPFLEKQLASSSLEERIRTLKAIAQIGYISHLDVHLHFVKSEHWQERLMLAKLLIHAPQEVALPRLQELLHDSSWWVRSQAAQSIRNYKMGQEVLESIILSSTDRYAIDMVQEVLGKE